MDESDIKTGSIIMGTTREVYIGAKWVTKRAINDEGFVANQREYSLYQYNLANPDKVFIPIAPCELINDDILRMRRVEVLKHNWANLPSWVGYVDCGQIGVFEGKLVAYDL